MNSNEHLIARIVRQERGAWTADLHGELRLIRRLAAPPQPVTGDWVELRPTLDGIDYTPRERPADYRGIEWLQQNAGPDAVVLEAVGGAYSDYGRVSSATGLPTLLGWANHERQWRGERYDELAGTREQDIREIYNTLSTSRARELLEQYGVQSHRIVRVTHGANAPVVDLADESSRWINRCVEIRHGGLAPRQPVWSQRVRKSAKR